MRPKTSVRMRSLSTLNRNKGEFSGVIDQDGDTVMMKLWSICILNDFNHINQARGGKST